jgi:hypothetical protein
MGVHLIIILYTIHFITSYSIPFGLTNIITSLQELLLRDAEASAWVAG